MQSMQFLLHGKIREVVSYPVKSLKIPVLSGQVFCKAFPARQEIAERFRQSDTMSSMAHETIERLQAAVGGKYPWELVPCRRGEMDKNAPIGGLLLKMTICFRRGGAWRQL